MQDITPASSDSPAGQRRSAPAPMPGGPSPRIVELLLAGLGGFLTDAAFPARSWWPLAFVGIALLLLGLRRDSVVWGWLVSFVWGLGFFGPHLWWANAAVGEPIGWIALSIAQAGIVGGFGAGVVLIGRVRWIGDRPWAWVVAVAAVWVAVEQLRASWPFGGLPWGTLAFSQTDAPLRRLAPLGSTVLVSAAVVLIAALLVCALRAGVTSRSPRPVIVPLLVASVLSIGPVLVPLADGAESGSLRIGAVQGNVPQQGAEALTQAREVTANHAAGTHALLDQVEPGELDLVLWPESSADIDPRSDAEQADLVAEAAEAAEAPILLGTQRYLTDPQAPAEDPDRQARYNEIILWEPGSGAAEDLIYAKQHPVPFGEYMPYRDFFRFFTDAVDLIGVDMLAGSDPGILDIPLTGSEEQVLLGVGICFEVAYDDIIRAGVLAGGEMIVIPTNNASFDNSALSAQQLAMSQFRAVEHGRSVVQVSTMGLSGIITPDGTFQGRTGLWSAEQMVHDVPLRTSLTPATALGQWPGIVVSGAGVLAVLAGVLSSIRNRPRASRHSSPQEAGESGQVESGDGTVDDDVR